MPPISINIPDDLLSNISASCDKLGVNRSEFVVRAVSQVIAASDPEFRKATLDGIVNLMFQSSVKLLWEKAQLGFELSPEVLRTEVPGLESAVTGMPAESESPTVVRRRRPFKRSRKSI